MTLTRSPIKRRPRKDPVSAQVAAEVFERDIRIAGGCVAPHLDATAGMCRDRWNTPVLPYAREALTLDHVREHSGGERRSIPRWLISSCHGHGVQSWELGHTAELRAYLAKVNP